MIEPLENDPVELLLLDDVEARTLLPLNEEDEKIPDCLKESNSCVSIVEAESDLLLCVFEEECGYCIVLVSDEAKLVELLETCDEEAFVDEDIPKTNEVVIASPSAATALITHIGVQIIIVLELMVDALLRDQFSHSWFYVMSGSSLSCQVIKEGRLVLNVG